MKGKRSTTSSVIRYGDLPVLVVNGPARRPYARPIASVDFGETTRTTLETLLRVVGPAVTQIVLAHSYRIPFEAFAHPSYPYSRDYRPRRDARAQAATKAAEALAALPRWGSRGALHWPTAMRVPLHCPPRGPTRPI